MSISNHIHVDELQRMSVAEIARMPVEQLALLQESVQRRLNEAKELKQRFDAALDRRFGVRAQGVRASYGKDTGVVRFEDGPVTITAELPKRVVWDQERLAALRDRIADSGDDPDELIETVFKVSERSYMAWPASLRELFMPARTIKTGKPSYRLELNGRDAS